MSAVQQDGNLEDMACGLWLKGGVSAQEQRCTIAVVWICCGFHRNEVA